MTTNIPTISRWYDYAFVVPYALIGVSFFLSPLYLLFLLAFFYNYSGFPFFSFFSKVFVLVFLVSVFYFRDYGVFWTSSSGDDVIQYLVRYNELDKVSFIELFTRFFARLGDYEPLWYFPWWIMKNYLHGSNDAFIFSHYLLTAILIIFLCRRIDENRFILVVLCYLFLFPDGSYSNAHLFRAQVSFLVFCIGLTELPLSKRRGYFLLFISSFFQMVTFAFAFLVILYAEFVNRGASKVRFIVFCLGILVIFPVLFKPLVDFLANGLGFSKILSYLERDGVERMAFYFKSLLIIFLFIGYVGFFNYDRFVSISFVINFFVIGFFLMLPEAQIIYERLFIFSLPMIALSFGNVVAKHFPTRYFPWAIGLVIVIAIYRVYTSIHSGSGVYQYLAFGELLYPFGGYLKLMLLK